MVSSKDVESGNAPGVTAAATSNDPKDAKIFGIPVKHAVLVLMTIQNAGAVLMMRWTRSMREFCMINALLLFIVYDVCVSNSPSLLHTHKIQPARPSSSRRPP